MYSSLLPSADKMVARDGGKLARRPLTLTPNYDEVVTAGAQCRKAGTLLRDATVSRRLLLEPASSVHSATPLSS
jgi:hypothetical protein